MFGVFCFVWWDGMCLVVCCCVVGLLLLVCLFGLFLFGVGGMCFRCDVFGEFCLKFRKDFDSFYSSLKKTSSMRFSTFFDRKPVKPRENR